MKERPILFSSEMVMAIMTGNKTQTRRVLKPEPCGYEPRFHNGIFEFCCDEHNEDEEVNRHEYKCPYGKIGDKLWVREAFWNFNLNGEQNREFVEYRSFPWDRADQDLAGGWKPSIHMPRWASQATLEITNIRVEKLQDISEQDAMAEGVTEKAYLAKDDHDGAFWQYHEQGTYAGGFGCLWDKINGKKYPWESNPWVWVVEFKQVG